MTYKITLTVSVLLFIINFQTAFSQMGTVSFEMDVSEGCSPLEVNFTNTSDDLGAGWDYEWSFGDGNTSNDFEPTHVYETPGQFPVNLIAYDNGMPVGAATDEVNVGGLDPTVTPEICLVTADENSEYNIIVWENPQDEALDYVNIYREIDVDFQIIGSVSGAALSQFVDETGADPNEDSYAYRISYVDTCGTETELSMVHETMHLEVYEQQGDVELVWLDYSGFGFNEYIVLRADSELDEFEEIGTVGEQEAPMFTDVGAPEDALYRIEVIHPNGCVADERAVSHNSSRSNVRGVSGGSGGGDGDVSVQDYKNGNHVQIFPNPFTGNVSVSFEEVNYNTVELRVVDITGKLVYSKTYNDRQIELNLESLQDGIYFLNLSFGQGGNITRKIIKL